VSTYNRHRWTTVWADMSRPSPSKLTSTTAPRYFAPRGRDGVGVVSLSESGMSLPSSLVGGRCDMITTVRKVYY
jgi:hypothetical protein